MNTQGIIIVLVVGLVMLVPLWTVASVRRRYGVSASLRPWWWLWIRIGCNGIMGAGVALTAFGVWAETQGIRDPSWGELLRLMLIAAFLGEVVVISFLSKSSTETLYRESFLLMGLWLVVIAAIMIMCLVNVHFSAHILNGLLLTGFGAMFTRLLKRWI